MPTPAYLVGIDTGGTCTDGVLLTRDSARVLKRAKVPTTPQQLSDGIGAVLAKLLEVSGVAGPEIGGVTLSTTVATNSVVENKGARVALLVIGRVKHFTLPVSACAFLKGGHTITGEEEEPLDLERVIDTIGRVKSAVDAYAVCASMSMKNPAHELVAEKAIAMIDPKPVFCSHRVSSQPGMHERAATSALHARLMPVMQRLIEAVQAGMQSLGLCCPLGIVTGSGSLIDPAEIVNRSGKTVASGPACTAFYGARMNHDTALVVDVGGTTTDIATIENGRPLMAVEGCSIESWTTQVRSVDLYTGGIGGDSLVQVGADGNLSLGPARVVPIAHGPGNPSPESWLGPDDSCRLLGAVDNAAAGKPPETNLWNCLHRHGPMTPAALLARAEQTRGAFERELEELRQGRWLIETGFTPTDALRVLGRTDFGDRLAAGRAADCLARAAGVTPEAFCRQVIRTVEERIVSLILSYLFKRTWEQLPSGFLSNYQEHPLLKTEFSLKVPLIGLGGAAPYFLPGVAERLQTTVTFPDHYQVGNAVGAAMIGARNLAEIGASP